MRTIDATYEEGLAIADALWRARGLGVARLVDVADAPDGGIRLVIDDGESPLGERLDHRLTLGEAVAVVVPLIECVDRLSGAGIAHGAIGLDAVRLDASGAPVIGGFAGAGSTAVDDRVALVALIRTVLSAVTPRTDRVMALVSELDGLEARRRSGLVAFAERLRAAAAASPARLEAPADDAGTAGGPESRWDAEPRRGRRVRARFWVPAAAVLAVAAIAVPVVAVSESSPRAAAPRPSPSVAPLEVTPRQNAVGAALALHPEASGAAVLDDYGDVVLVRLETSAGPVDVLIERTESGWRLRGTIPTRDG